MLLPGFAALNPGYQLVAMYSLRRRIQRCWDNETLRIARLDIGNAAKLALGVGVGLQCGVIGTDAELSLRLDGEPDDEHPQHGGERRQPGAGPAPVHTSRVCRAYASSPHAAPPFVGGKDNKTIAANKGPGRFFRRIVCALTERNGIRRPPDRSRQ